ncbi:NAD-glutamate dehydrogenase domain-containing protein [Frankia sp. Cr2]|uniref:NAD-glutamate dehydrogenase domain-containing protein n=1 Tax=Frankia sp. Cr2 TaxID=3073932 RepID=UPI002AD34815|nr:NAD-glutamate dehydrogenase domain-containing protein [Frankia sp. Cr2]
MRQRPAGYRVPSSDVRTDAEAATAALLHGGEPGFAAARTDDGGPATLAVWLAWHGEGPPIADVVPVLTNLGLRATTHRCLPSRAGPLGGTVSLDEYHVRATPELADAAIRQMDGLRGILAGLARGDIDSDSLDSLVLTAGLTAREVGLLRALFRYLRLAGTSLGTRYAHRVLTAHPSYAHDLVALFHARMDPARASSTETGRLHARLEDALGWVTGINDDMVLRRLRDLVLAVVRTTFYPPSDGPPPDRPPPDRPGSGRPGSDHAGSDHAGSDHAGSDRGPVPELCGVDTSEPLALKIASGGLLWLPPPVPEAETFVSSVLFDAVHLRGAALARGGIRWSDRQEDLRTEILGLMKAQRVKNAIIVPDGAKGGFVLRRPPSDPDELARLARSCYAEFMRALLALVDDRVDGATVRRSGMVCHDGPDSYLVVAADKGTARFSDLANEVARSSGYWLGDAFASGGRSGYDHKALGITARGAWESVRRHFAELGVDADREPLTVVGIGDMSGDVFGNGMLLSRYIRLVAAFDHRHIFLDPDPDPARSFAERERLAALPGSSWDDYDRSALSPGGGVFALSAKQIELTEQVRELLGVGDDALPADAVVRAVLRAPVDLLWNGGVGTWIKASTQEHAAVGDKARDGMRVDAVELRARVVAEGGNLGLTDAARVEFAMHGGRCNTDFVDNSAGVNCSDREVNIKIGLDLAISTGMIDRVDRERLLASATDDVTRAVLVDSARQALALSAAERHAMSMADGLSRFITHLVETGEIDPEVETLPDAEELGNRLAKGRTYTRPEIAVLHAYAKRMVARSLLASSLPDEPVGGPTLDAYLPASLRGTLREHFDRHPLRREIIASQLANSIIDRVGAGFLYRLRELSGADTVQGTRAFVITRDLLGLTDIWDAMDAHCLGEGSRTRPAVGSTDPAAEALLHCHFVHEESALWLLRARRSPLDIAAETTRYADGMREVAAALPAVLATVGSDQELAGILQLAEQLYERGLPARLAEQVAWLDAMSPALDIVDVALRNDLEPGDVLHAYTAIGTNLGLGRLGLAHLIGRGAQLPGQSYWEHIAAATLRADVARARSELTEAAMATPEFDLDAAIDRITTGARADRVRAVVDDVTAAPRLTSAMISVVAGRLSELIPRR